MCIRILKNQYWLNAGSELTPNLDGLGVREGTEDCMIAQARFTRLMPMSVWVEFICFLCSIIRAICIVILPEHKITDMMLPEINVLVNLINS